MLGTSFCRPCHVFAPQTLKSVVCGHIVDCVQENGMRHIVSSMLSSILQSRGSDETGPRAWPLISVITTVCCCCHCFDEVCGSILVSVDVAVLMVVVVCVDSLLNIWLSFFSLVLLWACMSFPSLLFLFGALFRCGFLFRFYDLVTGNILSNFN